MKIVGTIIGMLIVISSAYAVESIPRNIGPVKLGMTMNTFTKIVPAKIEDCLSECSKYEKYSEVSSEILKKIANTSNYKVLEVFFWKNKLYYMMYVPNKNKTEKIQQIINKLGNNYKIKKTPQGMSTYIWDDSKTLFRVNVSEKNGSIISYAVKDLTFNTYGSQW